jgi:hypothetical protein
MIYSFATTHLIWQFFLSQSPDPLACQITGQKYFKDRCNTLSKEANDAYNKLVSVTNLDKADNTYGHSQVQETIQISQSPEVSSFFFSYDFLYDFLCKYIRKGYVSSRITCFFLHAAWYVSRSTLCKYFPKGYVS